MAQTDSIFDNERCAYIDNGILMFPVKSSFVNAIGHDAINNVLAVKLNYGLYHYSGVSKANFNSFLWAESKGQFFNQHISNNFKVIEYKGGDSYAKPLQVPKQSTESPIIEQHTASKIQKRLPMAERETTEQKKADSNTSMPKFRGFLLNVLTVVFSFFIGFGWYGIWLVLQWICNEAGASEVICILCPSLIVTITILSVAALMTINEASESISKVEQRAKDNLARQASQIKLREDGVVAYEARVRAEIEIQQRELNRDKEYFENIISSDSQKYPWLAQQIADYDYILDKKTANYLETKKHPAQTAAKEVKRIAAEKRALQKQCKMWEYQFNYLEALYPWLSIFEDAAPMEGAKYAGVIAENLENEYDGLKDWLSPEEYAKLPAVQKYQLALERYNKRPKNSWQVGIAFERYVGYLFENEDYVVKYNGATEYKADMGIDILATKGNTALVVQCKRYSVIKQNEVHENTVFQLFGTATLYKIRNSKLNVIPAIYSTYVLSDVAKQCAETLNIELHENVVMRDYPMIKCNIAKDGEKIYHLPFDQQYDKVQISGKKGALYVESVAEAERLGFRRAYKWRPTSEGN